MADAEQKLETCEVCGTNSAKYTCPKCEVRTCTLTCINIHKKELHCDGIRDKTKFIPIRKFTDLDLLSDYRLLEEVGRTVEQAQKDKLKKFTRTLNLPQHLYALKQAANRSEIKLEFLPRNFSRNKENTTFYYWKTQELFWRIEWIFSQAENTRWITKRALDSKRLSGLLEDILEPSDKESNDADDAKEKELLNQKLIFYRSAGLSGIKVLLKAERVKKSASKFYELDVTLSLKENFVKKTIIEYPTIYVVLRDHADVYEVIDTDEEQGKEEMEDFRMQRYRRRPEKHNNVNKKQKNPVNYFFDHFDVPDSDNEDKEYHQNKKHKSFNIPEYNELVKMEH